MSQLAGGLAIHVGEVYALSAMFVGHLQPPSRTLATSWR
jgi:hypothetical protein